MVLLLQFSFRDTQRPIERLDIVDLSVERVLRFLDALETERGKSSPRSSDAVPRCRTQATSAQPAATRSVGCGGCDGRYVEQTDHATHHFPRTVT
ncbi:hypothetical protein D3C71_1567300 [compost metagenome]